MIHQIAEHRFEGLPKADAQVPSHLAKDLTNNGNLAQIAHNGQIYTLRITRNDKLILTK